MMWRERCVPKDWSDAVLVPFPEKGGLSYCDNRKGIALFDAVGKVVARVLQERLQELSEDEHPESHCDFRKEGAVQYDIHSASACREVLGA